MNDLIQTLAVYSLPVLFAITLHEAAHAYAAKYFGDNTAYSLGRMSLNPLKHVDLIGTILIPVVLFLLRSPFLFGYAKPVPVEFGRLRNPKKQMAFVALAGPLANLVMGLGWMILLVLLAAWGDSEDFFLRMARAGVETNLVIFAFNLIPLPPLDGGRVMTSILPNKYAWRFAQLEPYGFFIVLGLAFMNVLSFWMVPVMKAANFLLLLLISPLRLALG
ncbi:MAG: peptidase family [Paucimonas sp.]|nr:peptidase family [Paucimonas sp.]